MTLSEMRKTIKDTLESVLPALLATASLDNFDNYYEGPPRNVDKKELCVYANHEINATLNYEVGFIIQAQLYQVLDELPYHDVIFKAIKDNITATLLDLQSRDRIEFDGWPMDDDTSTSYCFYYLGFISDLDDCD